MWNGCGGFILNSLFSLGEVGKIGKNSSIPKTGIGQALMNMNGLSVFRRLLLPVTQGVYFP
jgi:hypothetical protein